MLTNKALTNLVNVKQLLGIAVSTEDAYLERLIEAASAYVEGQTGRVWLGAYSADVTEYPDPVGGLIFLKALPVKSITGIKEGETDLSYTSEFVGDYRWARYAEEGIVERGGGPLGFGSVRERAEWLHGGRPVEVKYKGGYQNQAALPADIVLATDSLVAEMYKAAQRVGVTSESMGSYSVSYQDADRASKALPGFLASLDRYRNVNVA